MPGDLERIGYDRFSTVVLDADIDGNALDDGIGGHVWDKEAVTGGQIIEGAGAGTAVRPDTVDGTALYRAIGLSAGREHFAKADIFNPGAGDDDDISMGVAIGITSADDEAYVLKARKGVASGNWEVKLVKQTAIGVETNLFPADATWHDTGIDETHDLGNPLTVELISVQVPAGLVLIARYRGDTLNKTGGGRTGLEFGFGYTYLDTSPFTGTDVGIYADSDGGASNINLDDFAGGNLTRRGYGGIGVEDWVIGMVGATSTGLVNEPDDVVGWNGGTIDLAASAFDPNANEELSYLSQVQHRVAIGSPLGIHVHFVTATVPGAGLFINWNARYRLGSQQSEFTDERDILWVDYDPDQQSVDYHHVTDDEFVPGWSGVDPIDPSSILVMNLARGNDAGKYIGDVYFLELDAHVLMHAKEHERAIPDLVNAERRWWI